MQEGACHSGLRRNPIAPSSLNCVQATIVSAALWRRRTSDHLGVNDCLEP